jgi:hypothetical protein
MLRESNPICRVARSADQLVDRFDTEQADVAVFAGLEKTSVFHLVNRRNRDVAEHFAGNREPDPFPLRVRDYGNFSFCSHWLHLSCEARRLAIGPSKSRRRDSARTDCASSIAIGHQWAGSSARLLRETGSPTGVPRPSKSPLLRFNSERRLRNVPHRKFQARRLPSSSVGFETFPNRSISRSALLAFVRIDRSERGEYRTLSADRYWQFSILMVAGLNRATSHCIVGEIPSRSAQIRCATKEASCASELGRSILPAVQPSSCRPPTDRGCKAAIQGAAAHRRIKRSDQGRAVGDESASRNQKFESTPLQQRVFCELGF